MLCSEPSRVTKLQVLSPAPGVEQHLSLGTILDLVALVDFVKESQASPIFCGCRLKYLEMKILFS